MHNIINQRKVLMSTKVVITSVEIEMVQMNPDGQNAEQICSVCGLNVHRGSTELAEHLRTTARPIWPPLISL